MDSYWFWLFLLAFLAALFTGPTVIALIRGIDGVGVVLLLNGLAFVTFVALPFAYIMAITLPRRIHTLDQHFPLRHVQHRGRQRVLGRSLDW
ncbi:hypothetical protein ACGFNU_44345 [Spirillospora sp. NPDC048911]|uniref:hypothetical protein n=1 Tax=Spirillospora sp. NPDC048911 TaxID=3364527 RepID=UPI003718CA84